MPSPDLYETDEQIAISDDIHTIESAVTDGISQDKNDEPSKTMPKPR